MLNKKQAAFSAVKSVLVFRAAALFFAVLAFSAFFLFPVWGFLLSLGAFLYTYYKYTLFQRSILDMLLQAVGLEDADFSK